MLPGYSRPVINPLQRQVNVLVRLQLEHGEPACSRQREHINHGAIGSRKRRHLRIAPSRIELIVQPADILNYERLQPALRMQPPPTAVLRAVRMARFADAPYQPLQVREIAAVENSFCAASPEHNFGDTAKLSRFSRQPGARELQPMAAECNLSRRQHSELRLRH